MKDDQNSTEDRDLLAKLWTVCEQLLHDGEYKSSYVEWLTENLLSFGDHSQRILDTAAGVGFPSLDLVKSGFVNVTCADADADLLRTLIAASQQTVNQPLAIRCMWQQLPNIIQNEFDTVLCLDASIAFMDSWGTAQMVEGPEEICHRVREVLRNFHQLTAPGGRFLVGLQKNNNRSNTDRYVMEVGKSTIGGLPATATWDMRYDWDARRKTWNNIVAYNGKDHRQTRHSYLFDKAELADFLVEVGFSKAVEIPTPEHFYEDVVVAFREA